MDNLASLAARRAHQNRCGAPVTTGSVERQETRRVLLRPSGLVYQDPSHRIQFVHTPKYTAWLNQIEMWFSILMRRLETMPPAGARGRS